MKRPGSSTSTFSLQEAFVRPETRVAERLASQMNPEPSSLPESGTRLPTVYAKRPCGHGLSLHLKMPALRRKTTVS